MKVRSLDDLPEHIRQQARRKLSAQDRTTDSPSNVEHNPIQQRANEDADSAVNQRYCIHIHSRRSRLTDPDGVSAKAAIDGLVSAGLLPDDSYKYVAQVSYSQEKVSKEQEETVIEIYEYAENPSLPQQGNS